MKTLKESWIMFKRNLPTLILFEIIYKIIAMAVIIPIIYGILNLSIERAGIRFLTKATIGRYFNSVSTYILFFVILIVLSIYFMINMSGLIYIMDYSHKDERANLFVVLFRSVFNAFRIMNPRNFGMFFLTVLVLPFTYTVAISGSLLGFKLPDFVNAFAIKHYKNILILVAVYLLLGLFVTFRIYAVNYYTLYRLSFKQSIAASKENVKKYAAKTVVGIIIFNICLAILLFLLEGAMTTVFAGVFRNLMNWKKFSFAINTFIQIGFAILYIIFSLISTPLIYSFICANFYQIEGDFSNIVVTDRQRKRREKKLKREKKYKEKQEKKIIREQDEKTKKRLTVIFLIIALFLNGTYLYLSINNRVNLHVLYSQKANITAHRGDSMHAPENTMAAFYLAVENQADMIELDVRQTKDGQFIIMHDENLKRTTGVDKKVGEMTLEEIKQLDAGSFFSEEFIGERIPTLEEALEFAVEYDIRLNIELKPAKTDQNFVENIIEILEEYDFINQCVVACTEYDVLCEIKEMNEDIETVYIINLAVGNPGDMENVDIFSIKHTYVSANMVNNIHENGKEIYAWTVNDQEAIKRLLLLDVDCIITDSPYETKDFMFNANESILSDFLQRLIADY